MGKGSEGSYGPTAALSEFITQSDQRALSSSARHEARRAITDIIGVGVIGSREPPSTVVARVAARDQAAGEAAVIGQGFRTSTTLAAMVNGTSCQALDFDDLGNLGNAAYNGHPTVSVAPAALAVADAIDATGRELIEAFIVGFEIVIRLGAALGGDNGTCYRRGFQVGSLFGAFGAMAAAARLLKLSPKEARVAFGITASGGKGIRANYGTMTKPFHSGEANRIGVLAALLAKEGFSASLNSLEERFGWAEVVASGDYDPARLTSGLGERLAIESGASFKRYPCCGANDPPIRAVLGLMAQNQLEANEISSMEVEIWEETLRNALIYPWPDSGLAGKFSLAFNVAAAWSDGRVDTRTFTDAKVRELIPFRDRITVRAVPSRAWVRIHARTVDGRELQHEQSTGITDTPLTGPFDATIDRDIHPVLSDTELAEKFRDNFTAADLAHQADRVLFTIADLEALPSIRTLTDLLL